MRRYDSVLITSLRNKWGAVRLQMRPRSSSRGGAIQMPQLQLQLQLRNEFSSKILELS